MGKKVIGLVVGSLRKGSYSKSIGAYISMQLKDKYDIKNLEIGSLPFYNEDDDTASGTLPQWEAFRHEVRQTNALLIITPEYNRSIPGVLKNALDVASRPYGKSAWGGKPAAVISASIGPLGAYGANQHLRQILGCQDVYLMQQPDAYLGLVGQQIDASGKITSDGLKTALDRFCQAYGKWIERFI